jgi:hypothetical protein
MLRLIILLTVLLFGVVRSQQRMLPLNFDGNSKLGSWPQIIVPHGSNKFLVELSPYKIVRGGFTRGIYMVDAVSGSAQLLPALADHSIFIPPNFKSDVSLMGA